MRCAPGSKRAQALEGVAEELHAHGRVAVGREHVEDAAAAGHLAGRGHRVLAAVAALVERLEQDLRRHLLARRQRHHAGLEQARRQDGTQEAGGGGDQGPEPAAAARRAGRRRGAARRRRGGAARGRARGPGAGKGSTAPARPGLRREGAQVLRGRLDVLLPRDHHEQGRLAEEEGTSRRAGP